VDLVHRRHHPNQKLRFQQQQAKMHEKSSKVKEPVEIAAKGVQVLAHDLNHRLEDVAPQDQGKMLLPVVHRIKPVVCRVR
jgi:hypothetical protein|tara:strand:+ start:674 stop:913 length:240 start_codon:yes stop_codon:yes gene_type:complete